MTKHVAAEVDYSTKQFLIVDDKAFIRNLVQSMLVKLRAGAIFHANSGEEAIALLERRGSRIDCIISDWNMTPIGGLELLRSVRTGEVGKLPVTTCFIMLTGTASASVVTPALALDVNAYLVKPVSFEKLVKTIGLAMARVWEPRLPKEYRTVGGLEVPPAVKESASRASPWVLWTTPSPQSAQLEEPQKEIRRPAIEIKQKQAENAPEVRNIRLRSVDKIKVGKVLAEDVTGDDGALLIAAGTVLNEELLSRLRAFAAGRGRKVNLLVGDG